MLVVVAKLITRAAVRLVAMIFAYSIATFGDVGPLRAIQTAEAIGLYLLVFVAIGLIFDLATRNWRKSWRFTSLTDVLTMAQASTVVALALLLAVFTMDRGEALPRSALLLTWLLDVGIAGGLLMLRRAAHENTLADIFHPLLGRPAAPR